MPRRPEALPSAGEPTCWIIVLLQMYLKAGDFPSGPLVFSMSDLRMVF
jgi:hypothetical protein